MKNIIGMLGVRGWVEMPADEVKKVKAWGVEQAVSGASGHDFIWFATKEARDQYYNDHNYCDKLRCKLQPECYVYKSYDEYKNLNN